MRMNPRGRALLAMTNKASRGLDVCHGCAHTIENHHIFTTVADGTKWHALCWQNERNKARTALAKAEGRDAS